MRNRLGFNRSSNFTFISTMVKVVFGLTFIFTLMYFLVWGFVAFKTYDVVSQTDFSGGVKPVLEKIWCGEPGCLDKK